MKYDANRAAKNISSLDSHTMVPTLTMLGRSWCPCRRDAGITEVVVATGAIMSVTTPHGTRTPWVSASSSSHRDFSDLSGSDRSGWSSPSSPRARSDVEDVDLALAAEPDAVVVGPDHPGRADHAVDALVAEQLAAAPDELAGGEVAEALASRSRARSAARRAPSYGRSTTPTVSSPCCTRYARRLRGGAVPDEVGLVLEDVAAVHPEHVAEVLVGRPDLEDLERLLVVALPRRACG